MTTSNSMFTAEELLEALLGHAAKPESVTEANIPRFINCKAGFLIGCFDERTGNFSSLGFTKNLRTATPFYLSDSAICRIARQAVRKARGNGDYFAILEASQIKFTKGENNHE